MPALKAPTSPDSGSKFPVPSAKEEPQLDHDNSINALIRRYRRFKKVGNENTLSI